VLSAVVTLAGDSLVSVRLQAGGTEAPADEHAATELDEGPSPIAPELKELAWGGGAFIVLLVVMRYAIFPRLREGMKRRYDSIEQGFTDADALREAAQGDVAAYQAALAGVRAEAAGRLDAARQTLEAERHARLAEVNAAIAERRAAAAAETAAARQAAEGHVHEAVGSVAARLVELATGNRPDDAALRDAVAHTANVGVR